MVLRVLYFCFLLSLALVQANAGGLLEKKCSYFLTTFHRVGQTFTGGYEIPSAYRLKAVVQVLAKKPMTVDEINETLELTLNPLRSTGIRRQVAWLTRQSIVEVSENSKIQLTNRGNELSQLYKDIDAIGPQLVDMLLRIQRHGGKDVSIKSLVLMPMGALTTEIHMAARQARVDMQALEELEHYGWITRREFVDNYAGVLFSGNEELYSLTHLGNQRIEKYLKVEQKIQEIYNDIRSRK